MERLQAAYAHLQAGDWSAAHEIVQADDSALASWMHALVHLLEGDEPNASYWFRKARRPECTLDQLEAELEQIKTLMEGK